MKITKSELKEIIREEAQKFKRKVELERELNSIQEQIEEVHANGTREIPGGGGHGYGKNFTKKGTHLVEDEFEEGFEDESVMNREDLENHSDSNHSDSKEDSDIDIDAILAEIMDENMDEGDCGTDMVDEMEGQHEGMDEMMDEMEGQHEGMDEMMDETEEVDEMMNESKNQNKKIISEEISRMQKLAGIKKII
jgi:hypothetical protein